MNPPPVPPAPPVPAIAAMAEALALAVFIDMAAAFSIRGQGRY